MVALVFREIRCLGGCMPKDVTRIIGLRVDGEAVTGVTYADYTEFAHDLLGLEPAGVVDLDIRRMGPGQIDEESLHEFVQRAAGLARAVYGQDPEDVERVDRDLRRLL
ncbi:hypothetical protein Taro_014001, partial [Colocasia esculenta]|nr:hypothetical protein [Colocasia esculenta]